MRVSWVFIFYLHLFFSLITALSLHLTSSSLFVLSPLSSLPDFISYFNRFWFFMYSIYLLTSLLQLVTTLYFPFLSMSLPHLHLFSVIRLFSNFLLCQHPIRFLPPSSVYSTPPSPSLPPPVDSSLWSHLFPIRPPASISSLSMAPSTPLPTKSCYSGYWRESVCQTNTEKIPKSTVMVPCVYIIG